MKMLMSKIEKNRENVGVKSWKKSWKHCEAKIEKSRENVDVKNRKIVKMLVSKVEKKSWKGLPKFAHMLDSI